jgi:hypothetical protein
VAGIAEVGDHLVDLQASIADAVAAHGDEGGGALHLGGQHVDVDIGPFEAAEDGLEFGECVGVARRNG